MSLVRREGTFLDWTAASTNSFPSADAKVLAKCWRTGLTCRKSSARLGWAGLDCGVCERWVACQVVTSWLVGRCQLISAKRRVRTSCGVVGGRRGTSCVKHAGDPFSQLRTVGLGYLGLGGITSSRASFLCCITKCARSKLLLLDSELDESWVRVDTI